jgi:hypothetical protein
MIIDLSLIILFSYLINKTIKKRDSDNKQKLNNIIILSIVLFKFIVLFIIGIIWFYSLFN